MDDEVETTTRHATELVREAMTMALYLSLSLLAVLVAMPVGSEDNRVRAGVTLLVTALGLLLAHHLAFRMSSRLVNEGLLTEESVSALQAQALGGVPVAVVAALPVFVLGESPGEEVAELLLVAFVALVGYRIARLTTTPLRSLVYVLAVVVFALAVILVKLAVGH
jgi:hypothetical protein